MKVLSFWAIFILVVTLLFAWVGSDLRLEREKREARYKRGELVDIGGRQFEVTKKVLADGKCYYIYQTDLRKVFAIPCEEK